MKITETYENLPKIIKVLLQIFLGEAAVHFQDVNLGLLGNADRIHKGGKIFLHGESSYTVRWEKNGWRPADNAWSKSADGCGGKGKHPGNRRLPSSHP